MTVLYERDFAAFLFDMDGTLLDSIAVANRVWGQWAERHGLDARAVIAAMHGVQVRQTIRRFAPPGMDVEREAASVTQAEMEDVDGIVAIADAARFLTALPADRWAIVTSAPRPLAVRRLVAAGVPIPPVFITAEDVVSGKPAPDCFLMAAEALGVPASECLVWEDSPAGIAAAEAAGSAVMVIGATHHQPMRTPHPVVANYHGLGIENLPGGKLRLVECVHQRVD